MKLLDATVPADRERLAAPSASVQYWDEDLSDLVYEMRAHVSETGALGLAAPQVGVPLRIFVMRTGNAVETVINPVLISHSHDGWDDTEGCLSLPGQVFTVTRWTEVKAGWVHQGEWTTRLLRGMPARVFQHEYDHLDGILISARGRRLL